MAKRGYVYLIGAGPGDPGLLTLKGASCLSQAEVVIYDRLVCSRLLSLAPEGAERIFAGKSAEGNTMSQEQINALLVEKGRAGRLVVRLKGGDPFVFGRGGEEALALAEAGIPFEVVPGVTAGVAGPAYAGIPVTHRGLSSAVVLVTGHEDPLKGTSDVDWRSIARVGSIVVYMGVGHLPQVVQSLLDAGRSAETPCAVVANATTLSQRTTEGVLGTIVQGASSARVEPPALLLVGEVVSLRRRLLWFERRPLFGLRVLVTRTREQASRLSELLERCGAEAVEAPLIRILEIPSSEELQGTLSQLNGFQWVVFTSANGVDVFFRRLTERGRDARALGGCSVCALGPGTAEALAGHGIRADLVPKRYLAEEVAKELLTQGLPQGARVLLARAEKANPVLPECLRSAGLDVCELSMYRTVLNPQGAGILREVIRNKRVNCITFASSSAVEAFVETLRGENLRGSLSGIAIGSIGPETSKALQRNGLRADVEASVHTIPGLVEALCEWARGRKTEIEQRAG